METIEQCVFANLPAASGLNLLSELIVCTPLTEIAEYQGTRATLEEEGIIPSDLKWPKGSEAVTWRNKNFDFLMRRERPKGLKGPRKLFSELDWWMLRCDPVQRKSPNEYAIDRKLKELSEARYRESQRGREEHSQQFRRYCVALDDEKFQAFKALIPGMSKTKRSRKKV